MNEGPGEARILAAALAATRRLEAEGCLEALAAGGHALLGGSFALAYLAGATGDDLLCLAAAGSADPGRLRKELGVLDAGLIRHLAPSGPALLPDAEVLLPTGEIEGIPPLGQALLVPLRSASGVVGLLLAIARRGEVFAAGAGATAARLVEELAPALENLRTVAALRELVIRDDTADCYNRRYLDHSLEDEVERARRFGGRLALIFLDMDNLKDVNTHHGHGAGSRVLYEASVRISRSIRSINQLFRYGGDEFVVLLPGTGLSGAREVAERVRREVASRPFELPSGARAQITASAGVSAWPEHGPSARRLVEAADAAMRGIKHGSKNAVSVAPVAPPSADSAGGGRQEPNGGR